MSRYSEMVDRGKRRHPGKFDESDLAPQMVRWFNNGMRIKVRSAAGTERTGRVGVTTGWKPAFLLMHRSSDDSSSDVLGLGDQVIGVQAASGRGPYRPVL